MQHQFEQDRREVRLKLFPTTKVERAFLEEFAKSSGTIRISKTVNEESQPMFTFTQEAK